jgi:hypothetical protein
VEGARNAIRKGSGACLRRRCFGVFAPTLNYKLPLTLVPLTCSAVDPAQSRVLNLRGVPRRGNILCFKCETCCEVTVAYVVLGTHPATFEIMRPSPLVLFVPASSSAMSLACHCARSNHVHLERRRATSCVLGISIRAVPRTK